MHKYADMLSLSGVSRDEFTDLLFLADGQRNGHPDFTLAGKNFALIFEKPSLRTRVTFEVAIRQLGGWPILLGPIESRLGERESIPDLARNLSLWVNAIVARVFKHTDLEEMARFSSVPVINALSDWEHPCQALADILTLWDVWQDFEGKTVAYVGDWNNVSRSLWKACELSGIEFRGIGPAGYGPAPEENAAWFSDISAVEGVDAIYTDVWASMGKEDELEQRIAVFQPYQVNARLMQKAGPECLFMHCLPAHRGLEVTDEVIDSDRSIVFRQAANRLPSEKAILISLLENHHETTREEGGIGLFGRSGHLHHHSLAQGKLWV